MKKGFDALILAAGKGTRFKSETLKVLHPLLGKAMIRWVMEALNGLKPDTLHLVVGYQKQELEKENLPGDVNFVAQRRQLGTGHAVMSAKKVLRGKEDRDLLVINGDLPLVQTRTLRPFLADHRRRKSALTFMTADLDDPTGFGRVIHTEEGMVRIIEEKEATPAQRQVRESNVGVYLFRIADLLKALPKIGNDNSKGEYYLTDLIEIMALMGKSVRAFKTSFNDEFIGVNDRFELALATEVLRWRKIKTLAQTGVTIRDPGTTWIDADVRIGVDTEISPNVVIEGRSTIGNNCRIQPFVHVLDSRLGDRVHVLTSTRIEHSRLESGAQVGPFSRLRPNCIIREGAKVGNFVEMKNTDFGKEAKAGHMSYLGDSEIESKVNIGAGTITCNYDGVEKHKTRIEEGAFIGSGTELVAPVKIGKGAYIGAGSTITKDVSSGALAVVRGEQVEKKGWARRRKRKKKCAG